MGGGCVAVPSGVGYYKPYIARNYKGPCEILHKDAESLGPKVSTRATQIVNATSSGTITATTANTIRKKKSHTSRVFFQGLGFRV